jgi:histidyl-tRNA synthetase
VSGPDLFAQVTVDEARPRVHALLDELRLAGVRCEGDLAGRSAKGQQKHADRLKARLVAQCGADEWAAGTVLLRDRTRGGTETVALDDLVRTVIERIGT